MVFGTRPEAIKMAPLYKALKAEPSEFEIITCITAQHRNMLDQVLEAFDISADLDLDLMSEDQDLFDITSSVMLEMRKALQTFRPDVVLVHGDTSTAFATATACFYLNIPVWHVEAGLRTYDIHSPFPEEFNRQVISKVAEMHLAPTKGAENNLLKEKVSKSNILVTGNTVIDSLLMTLDGIDSNLKKKNKINKDLNKIIPFEWSKDRFILITGHRRENFGQGFQEICQSILELASKYPDIHFIYPLHLNPNVQVPVRELLDKVENIHLIEPLNYEPFVYLLKHCYLVMTDSGGIQEEAPSLGKPVIVLRNNTERPEAVDAGTVLLVGTNKESIVENISKLLEDVNFYERMASAHNPYGDGRACGRIVSALKALKL